MPAPCDCPEQKAAKDYWGATKSATGQTWDQVSARLDVHVRTCTCVGRASCTL